MSLGRFKAYPAYKECGVNGVGPVPTHWEVRRLKYACDVNPSASEVRGLEPTTEVSFVPMEAVGDGGLDLTRTRLLAEVGNGFTYFHDGDVIVAKITPCFENGKGAHASGLLNGIAFGTTELHVIRPRQPDLDVQFLFYVTVSHVFRRFGEAQMYGAGGQKRVPNSFVENLRHPLPPIPEQRAIAAFLDRETARIDTLVAKKEQLIELLQEERAAVITRAVTKGLDPEVPMKDFGVEWLGHIPAHWEVRRFRYGCQIVEGQVAPDDERYRGRVLIAPNHVESGTGRILFTETADEQSAISGKYVVKPGDIIYSKIRPALNKACIASGDWLCSADMYPIRITAADIGAPFLLYFMLSEAFVRLMTDESMRVAMPKVNRESLTGSPLLIPRPSEQSAIVSVLDRETARIDALIAKVRQGIERLKEYRVAIISAAVTGKIDLGDEAA